MATNILGIPLYDQFQHSCLPNLKTYNTTEEPVSFRGPVWQLFIQDRSSSYQRKQSPICSSSFNQYTQYGHYSGHPLMKYHQSFEKTEKSDSEGTEDKTSFDNTDQSQSSYSGREECRRFTYTHLSDVSDTEEDVDQNNKIPKRFNRTLAKKRFEKLRPYQLALPLICTYPIMEKPTTSTLDPVVSDPQIVTNPQAVPAAASNIICRLKHTFQDINEPSQKIPKLIELEEESIDKHKDSVHNWTSRNVKLAAEEDMPTPANDEAPAEISTLEGTSKQSSIIAVDPLISPETDNHSGTQQEKLVSQHLPDEETPDRQKPKKRPGRKPKTARKRDDCSRPKQLHRSLTVRSLARRNDEPRNQAHCVASSQPRRSPRLQRAAKKCATAIKKSREPWDHKGLFRFVAEYAFKLPRDVWKQVGKPRRSKRIAEKMERRRYLLRGRSRTKS